MNAGITVKEQSSKSVRGLGPKINFLSLLKPAAAAALAAATLLLPSPGWAGGVVTNCTESALRAAMAGGGAVTFACDGAITLASTITNDVSVTLDGSGHQVTLNGGNAVRVFFVNTNVNLTVANLIVAAGWATDALTFPEGTYGGGGAIFNNGGTVNLLGTLLQTNSAYGAKVCGGAICNRRGTINATNCTLVGNSAPTFSGTDASPTWSARGGAIYNDSGAVTLQRCVFTANQAVGASALAGWPYIGDDANGGAIYNAGSLLAEHCAFVANSATGGQGGAGVNGQPAQAKGQNGWPGKPGGAGVGGALFNGGVAKLINSTFGGNTGAGGAGGTGGAGGQGIEPPPKGSMGGDGGAGGPGGDGFGGIYNNGLCYLTNCTVASNSSRAGAGGAGGLGGIGNTLPGFPGLQGPIGSAQGGISTFGPSSSFLVVNTLLAGNTTGGNCSGTLTDAGHNLSSDGTCSFTGIGSLNNTDPNLGPLANNGGPTLTMALLPGSPAIDAGDTSAAPSSDQRGFPRPAGAAADIGAFEYGSAMPTLAVSRSGATGLNILGSGNAGGSCRLLSSTDLSNWVPMATNQIGADGTILFYDNCAPGGACRFYRLVMP